MGPGIISAGIILGINGAKESRIIPEF